MLKCLPILLLPIAVLITQLHASEPLGVEPDAVSKPRSTIGAAHGGGDARLFEFVFFSDQGYLVDRGFSYHGGGGSFSVWDCAKTADRNRGNGFLWLYKGLIVRSTDTDPEARMKARDQELKDCWKQRGVWLHQLISYWRELTKEKQQRIYDQWYNDPIGNYTSTGTKAGEPRYLSKMPGIYSAGMGAVSPDLKYCFLYEQDETKEGWAPDGYVLKVPYPRNLILNLETGERKPTPLSIDGKPVLAEDISRDQKYLAAIGPRGPVIFENGTYKPLHELAYPREIRDICFSPDSRKLAAFGYSSVWVWNVETGRVQAKMDYDDWHWGKETYRGDKILGLFGGSKRASPLNWVEFSLDSRYLWANANRWEPPVQPYSWHNLIWDVEKDRRVKTLTDDQIERMEGFGPIPGTVILTEKDHLSLVDIQTGSEVARLMLPAGSPPRRYRVEYPKKNPNNPAEPSPVRTFLFRTISRPDGLVVGWMEAPDPQHPGQAAEADCYIRWNLTLYLEEIRKRMKELQQGRK